MPKKTDFYLMLDDERAADWEPILGSRHVPIRGGKFEADLIGAGSLPPAGVQTAVLVDLEALTEEQVMKICDHLSAKSGVSPSVIHAEIRRDGLPIRTAGCSLVIRNPQRWI